MSKRISQLTELTSGQVATDDYIPILDTSAGQTKKVKVSTLTGSPDFGWSSTGESWSYSSYDSTNKTGVITVPSDATTKYNAGMRIRISQTTGGTKYGIITKVATTALTVYFGTDYSLTNEAISSPVYSVQKAPLLFPLDPAKWTVKKSLTTDRSTTSTSYASLTDTAVAPIGAWQAILKVCADANIATTNSRRAFFTLSSDGSTETNPDITVTIGNQNGAAWEPQAMLTGIDWINVTTATTFTLMGKVNTSSITAQLFHSAIQNGYVKFVCAYL